MDTLTLRVEQDEIAVASAEIAEIEVRLGTSFERPNDFNRCVELVHRIGNLLQVEGLRGEMETWLASFSSGSSGGNAARPAKRVR